MEWGRYVARLIMLCVSGEAASTGNLAYPAQGLLNPNVPGPTP